MIDPDYTKIKESMKLRSMDFWGISEEHLVDPLIEMMLDVFAYEMAKINQDLKISDAKLLERMSKILVKESWSLPSPAHALLTALPSQKIAEINRRTRFYCQKMTQGESHDLFFTPLHSHLIIDASIRCVGYERKLVFKDENGKDELTLNTLKDKKIEDYSVWLGVTVEEDLIKELENIPICLLLRNSDLDTYLKLVKAYDYLGNEFQVSQSKFENEEGRNEHYLKKINRYYESYLYELGMAQVEKKKQYLTQRFGGVFDMEELNSVEENLFWIKLTFPVAFNKSELDKMSFSLNTFPIVNRKLVYKQHNIRRNGRIVSLLTSEIEALLNVESLMDNDGIFFTVASDNNINNLNGSYSLYFGDIDQFDERNAKAMLNRVIQVVREEGSAFSAVGYDLLNTYLEDLNEKLDLLEKKVKTSYKTVNSIAERKYLLTVPHKSSKMYECEYWNTNTTLANGIKQYTRFKQYKSNSLKATSVLLKSETLGGIVRNSAKEKINALRHGLVSKDRIVSVEDIKGYIRMNLGSVVESVSVQPGVGIASQKNQGLIRTTEVLVKINEQTQLNNENKKRMGNFLRLELQHKSVQSIPYRVTII